MPIHDDFKAIKGYIRDEAILTTTEEIKILLRLQFKSWKLDLFLIAVKLIVILLGANL